ncbi:MAG: hypothetical protein H6589_05360 [Flavobacteriales bacterium]|nr:hypothetical protein [Flavobacteriales bacterium]
MNHVRDSLNAKNKYKTKERWVKPLFKKYGYYKTDTLAKDTVIVNVLKQDSNLIKAAKHQVNYIYEINKAEHEQYPYYNGIKVEVDTILKTLIDREKYFKTNLKSEICLQTGYGYKKNGYFIPFRNETEFEIYKFFSKTIVNLYLSSKGHRELLLHPRYKLTGIATVESKDGYNIFNTIVFD